MYGMVNEGIKVFITEQFGAEKWQQISQKAILNDQSFILLKTYPDKVTYDLVGAISEVLEIAPEVALEAYGKYWVSFAVRVGYENLLMMFGPDFHTCLQNLNHMHEHMGSFMADIVAPAFHVIEESQEQITVDYVSSRAGLVPFVRGLLLGLLERYNEKAEVFYVGEFGEAHRFKISFK